jgi:hypothetical protein
MLRRYAEDVWRISTAHFDSHAARIVRHVPLPLERVLIEGSTYNRTSLKRRLYETGLEQRAVELCCQGEEWRGRRMALILDHVNGVRDDHRLANLRIVCPNCNATLPTHAGRGTRIPRKPRPCHRCGQEFIPTYARQRYCSRECGQRYQRTSSPLRRAARPPYEQLMAELAATSYVAVARRHGVRTTRSGNGSGPMSASARP